MFNYFEYKVSALGDDRIEEYYGVISAENYPEAIQTLIKSYNNIEEIYLSEWDSLGCLEMSKNCLDELKESMGY